MLRRTSGACKLTPTKQPAQHQVIPSKILHCSHLWCARLTNSSSRSCGLVCTCMSAHASTARAAGFAHVAMHGWSLCRHAPAYAALYCVACMLVLANKCVAVKLCWRCVPCAEQLQRTLGQRMGWFCHAVALCWPACGVAVDVLPVPAQSVSCQRPPAPCKNLTCEGSRLSNRSFSSDSSCEY